MAAEALVELAIGTLFSEVIRVAKSSQTQKHHYRRTRGRIVPGSSNQEAAAPTPASNPSPPREGSSGHAIMGKELFEASITGSVPDMERLVEAHGPDILLTVTPYGNSPLHLAVMLGHDLFAKEVCWQAPPLILSCTNIHGETPLIAALMARNELLSFWLINAASQHLRSNVTGDLEGGNPVKEMLLKCDRHQENALHHALRNGFEKLASVILYEAPSLSEQVNKNGESAMHMAC